jgi:carboxymethylenebutenolidase
VNAPARWAIAVPAARGGRLVHNATNLPLASGAIVSEWLELTAGDGHRFAAFRASPAGRARGGLIVIQEIFGVNGHIQSVCEGYAADGYDAIAPALFDRVQRGVVLGYGPDDVAEGRRLRGATSSDAALLDVAATLNRAASAGKVGIVGYCWGGLIAWLSAARVPGLACAVTYYGGGMVDAKDEDPRCPVQGHFGRRDTMIPVAGITELARLHPEVEVFFYDADHGFNCDRRASYEPESARLARSRTLDFLSKHVGTEAN